MFWLRNREWWKRAKAPFPEDSQHRRRPCQGYEVRAGGAGTDPALPHLPEWEQISGRASRAHSGVASRCPRIRAQGLPLGNEPQESTTFYIGKIRFSCNIPKQSMHVRIIKIGKNLKISIFMSFGGFGTISLSLKYTKIHRSRVLFAFALGIFGKCTLSVCSNKSPESSSEVEDSPGSGAPGWDTGLAPPAVRVRSAIGMDFVLLPTESTSRACGSA